MNWFLHDIGLRHERVKCEGFSELFLSRKAATFPKELIEF